MVGLFQRISVVGILAAGGILCAPKKGVELWAQKPVVRPEVPAGVTTSTNPIDAFVAAELKKKGLQPAGPAEKQALLRRIYLDLTGILPTPAQQDEG